MEDLLKKFKEVLEKYKKLRPEPERSLDQVYATEETVVKRILLINQLGEIENQNILFLGDDDLNSICLNLFFKPKKTLVIDIDQKILDLIQTIAENENLKIKTFNYDLRNPLPKKIDDSDLTNFDIVFFDPPYTPLGVNTFLLRAMEASLGKGKNFKRKKPEFLEKKYYLMCYGYTLRETERGLKIQKIITDLGLIIHQKFRDFNFYYGAESLGSKSDLYILKPTPKVNLKLLDSARSKFYTHYLS